jgi:hypothetical protein
MSLKGVRIEVGDFVNHISEFGDVWHEVLQVFPADPAVGLSDALVIADDNRSGTDYTYHVTLRKVHRRDEPWRPREARIVHKQEGTYGRTKYGQPRTLEGPLPLKFLGGDGGYWHGKGR